MGREIDPDPTNTSQSKAWLAILTALEQAIPGLGGVIEGRNVVLPRSAVSDVVEIAARNEAAQCITAVRAMLSAAEGEGK